MRRKRSGRANDKAQHEITNAATVIPASERCSWRERGATPRPTGKGASRFMRQPVLGNGGFTELSLYGRWRTTADQYVESVRYYLDRIGGLDFAASQDWMCEPVMLARTGLCVREHQDRTVTNFLRLRELAPEVPGPRWCRVGTWSTTSSASTSTGRPGWT
ncbi:DUF7221 family queuine tRNA-ribosyltransferase-like protein [Amycolatopsis arida]|uniref:deazapurine DNA modification protein DpdA family protein n=1 Tax=Amycolatopsis arida TaxID=587909 RepID=UPI003C7C2484